MKKLFLILLMALPLMAFAQNEAKYLAGAVPEKNGKVEFTAQYAVDGHNKTEVYKTMKAWCESLTSRDGVIEKRTRLAYENEANNELVVSGEEYLVFTNSALSLDRTRIYYNLRVVCTDNSYTLQLTRLRYLYDENRDGGIRYNAEELITDEMALNKAKTKLIKAVGKFRTKTIDLKDELFTSASKAFGETTIRTARVVQPEAVQTQAVVTTPAAVKIQVQPKPQPTVQAQPATTVQLQATTDDQEQTATFTLENGAQTAEMLKNSDTVTLTLISKNGGVSLLEFTKTNTTISNDGKTCTFTGKVSSANVN